MKFSTKYFPIAAIALYVFLQACKKEGAANNLPPTIVYTGILYKCATAFTPDSVAYPTTKADSNYSVTVTFLANDSLKIEYRGNKVMGLQPDSTFNDHNDFSGSIHDDNLQFRYHMGVACEESFNGKKQ